MQAASAQIAENLRLEDRIEPRHALDFDDDSAFDDEVDSILSNTVISVGHPDNGLPVESNFLRLEFQGERILVRSLSEAWTQRLVNVDRAPDDALSDLVAVIHARIAEQSARHSPSREQT